MQSLQNTALGGGDATPKSANYVLVATDAGTTVAMDAAGATTITVNTGLFAAGDTVFIQNRGAGACTVTAGTATVATAGSLILPQNDAGILYFTSPSAAIFYDYIQAGAVSPLTTKGDLYTFSTSDARLPVGSDNSILVADSGETTGLRWSTPAAGGMTLLSTTTLSGASTTISGINQTHKNLEIVIYGVTNATADGYFKIDPNGSNNITSSWGKQARTTVNVSSAPGSMYPLQSDNFEVMTRTNSDNVFNITIPDYVNATNSKSFIAYGYFYNPTAPNSWAGISSGVILTNSAITSLVFTNTGGNFSTGTVLIYGVS